VQKEYVIPEQVVKESSRKAEGMLKRKDSKAREDKDKRQKKQDDLESGRYYEIHRADGSYKTYIFFSQMRNDFDREDLIVLYRLFNEKYASTRPCFDDLMLWGDMKVMFEPNSNDVVWKNHNSQELIEWKLYDSCGVHSLMLGENRRDLPRDNPLVSVEVLRYDKRRKSENKEIVPTEIELVPEQTQQGTSREVSLKDLQHSFRNSDACYHDPESISPTSFQDMKLIHKLQDDKKCMKKVEPSSRSKAIEDIISIGSFMEALVLNHYVLVRKIL
ncbi:hypothetical protein Tco_1321770, partial [Tanacetum coccineum]